MSYSVPERERIRGEYVRRSRRLGCFFTGLSVACLGLSTWCVFAAVIAYRQGVVWSFWAYAGCAVINFCFSWPKLSRLGKSCREDAEYVANVPEERLFGPREEDW